MTSTPAPLPDLDRKVVYRLLNDNGTYGTVLHAIALRSYGPEIYELDPLELFTRLEEDYGGRLTEEHENKLNAILTLMTTDAFHEEKDAFRAICNALTSGDPGMDLLDELTVPEIFWGIYEAEVNRDSEALSPGIQEMIEQAILSEADDPDEAEDLFSYVFSFLREARAELQEQLRSLGMEAGDLPPVDAPEEIMAAAA